MTVNDQMAQREARRREWLESDTASGKMTILKAEDLDDAAKARYGFEPDWKPAPPKPKPQRIETPQQIEAKRARQREASRRYKAKKHAVDCESA